MLPKSDEHQPAPLAFARRISAWVQYQQAGPIEAITNGKIVRDAARKLAILYPMVRQQLRLLVHHPDSLDSLKPALNDLVNNEGLDGFAQIHLIITHRPGQESVLSLSPLDELIVRGAVVPERIEISNINKLAEWLQTRPAHLLVLPGQRRLEPLKVNKQVSDLHPLSLPHTLQYNRFKDEVNLLPRSQQRDPSGPEHPFGAYHEIASAVGQLSNQEVSGASMPRANSPDLPAVLPYGVFIIAGAPAEPPTGALALARAGGSRGDLVVTQFTERFVKGVENMLTNSNYQPRTDELFKLLRELEEIGRTPLFNTISAKTPGGFDANSLKGQLGQAVALRWYAEKAGDQRCVVISLDSALARRSWLAHRESDRRNDLLGMRWLPGGGISLDLIEVKSYEVGGPVDGEGTPGEQLRSVARDLLPVVSGQSGPGGKLVTDCRREALRVQLFQEGQLRMPVGYDSKVWAEWIQQLNQALDGQLAVEVNLLLTEVVFNENEPIKIKTYKGQPNALEPEKKLDLVRVQLREPDIKRLLGELPPSSENGTAAVPISPAIPPTPTPGPQEPTTPVMPTGKVASVPVEVESTTKATQMEKHSTAPIATTLSNNSVNGTPALPHDGESKTDSVAVVAPPEPTAAETPIFINPPLPGVVEQLATSLYRGLQKYDLAPSGPIDPAIAEVGPSLILLKVSLKSGKKVADIQRLATDLQREMELDRPPVIGNLAGTPYVAVEVGRTDRKPIPLGPLLIAGKDEPAVSFPAGVSTNGQVKWLNLPRLPHMLIGGTTGAGKTIFLYGLIKALSQLNGPETVELLLIDPKQTDFVFFEKLPHLRNNRVVYESAEAVEALTDLLDTELPKRTGLLRQYGCRDIHEYRQETRTEPMPFIIVVIDEFADLVQSLGSKERKLFEEKVGRLAQRTRSVGIHLVIATQRPDMKVIPGNLKNNLDCRVAFRLASGTDSRVILDEMGAEDLLGAGDLLLKQQGQIQRLQGFYVSSNDLKD
ncbi:FtsK/SpoIIIE domain-containing protein [Hymenobacter canadensis]|uniref:FtsK/SpoIIIE domain-containing protein n=1 Tax=Hymenobacter canadensis TaxID=2999067 RepID=A0ABY7LVH4_9BACT|nr:FtsK/SpoIIIE domain-containing protein [Hymenobacter canadensis]WBA44051.1 FtsK/SpoIIIE domain-containing protein [Hymenobacter canadensis]